MNSREIAIPAGSVRAFAMAILAVFNGLVAAVRKELQYRADIRALQALSDRYLDDMGIQRHEIIARVRTHALIPSTPVYAQGEVVQFPVTTESVLEEKGMVAA